MTDKKIIHLISFFDSRALQHKPQHTNTSPPSRCNDQKHNNPRGWCEIYFLWNWFQQSRQEGVGAVNSAVVVWISVRRDLQQGVAVQPLTSLVNKRWVVSRHTNTLLRDQQTHSPVRDPCSLSVMETSSILLVCILVTCSGCLLCSVCHFPCFPL